MITNKNIIKFSPIASAILSVIVYGSEYQSSCTNFIQNYWIYSLIIMFFLFLLLVIIFNKIEKMHKDANSKDISSNLFFVLFFLYTIPVASFYTIPKIIDSLNPEIIQKEKLEFDAAVKKIYYVRRADDPFMIIKPTNGLLLNQEITLTISKEEANTLKENSLIKVYGTCSLVCFKYDYFKSTR